MSAERFIGADYQFSTTVDQEPYEEREWWDRDPQLVTIEKPFEMADPDERDAAIFEIAQQELFEILQHQFTLPRDGAAELPDEGNHFVVLNPIFLGGNHRQFQQIAESSGEEFLEACRENIPETNRPQSAVRGKRITGNNTHPNFINAVFVDKDIWQIDQLDYDQRIKFFQSCMAKFGAFKNLFVFCDTDTPSQPISSAMLSTLEGGHPEFLPEHEERDFQELARRLRIFGSAVSTGGRIEHTERSIDIRDWRNNHTVRQIQELGRFSGTHDLLSDPVRVDDLVKGRVLRGLIKGLASYSQQAEGAFYKNDPELGLSVITASGKFGAIKTDLGPEDLIPVENVEGNLLRWRIDGQQEEKGESVEAEEFLQPLHELSQLFPNSDGTAPINWIAHYHRWVENNQAGIPVIKFDPEEDIVVGCGVDLMEEISKKKMRQALEIYHQSRGEVPYTVIEVANHGVNIVSAEDKGLRQFMDDVDTGKVTFTREIPQQ